MEYSQVLPAACPAQADNTATLSGTDGYIEIPVPWKPPTHESIFVIARGTPPKMDGPVKSSDVPPRETVKVPVKGELYGMEADAFASLCAGWRDSMDHGRRHAGKYESAGRASGGYSA